MPGQKKACINCKSKFNSNDNLVRHMLRSHKGCERFILKCSCCGKICANQDHLQNHIRQAKKNGFRCYDVTNKMDIVTTLELNNLKGTKQEVVTTDESSRGLKTCTHSSSFSSTKSEPAQLLFGVEQRVPVKRNHVTLSVESLYGLDNGSGLDLHTKKEEQSNISLSDPLKQMNRIVNTVIHSGEDSLKRQKLCSNDNSNFTSLVLYPDNDHTFYKKSDLEKERIISKQIDLYKSGSKARSIDCFHAKLSDGMSYDVCVPVNESKSQERQRLPTLDNTSTVVDSIEEDAENIICYGDEEDEAVAYDYFDLTGSNIYGDESSQTSSATSARVDITNTTDNTHSKYISDRCSFNVSHHSQLLWEETDAALIDLYNLHKKARAPIGLFDQTIEWLQKNATKLFNKDTGRLNKLKRRKPFIHSLYNKVYGKSNVSKVLPKLLKTRIPRHPTMIDSTVFDFREVMVSLLSNKEVMDPANLLFASDSDPYKIHPIGSPISSVISSDVFRRAHKRLCIKDNDVLWPLVVYNDEFNCDHNGKLKLDPLSVSFLRLPVHIRNQPQAWRTFGIVHSLKSASFQKVLSSEEKMQIHHIVLENMYKMVSVLQKEDGIPWKLTMKDGSEHSVNLKIYIQLLIGDTKGHDEHCGRKAGHKLEMKQCVRDCHVSMEDSNKWSHICTFRKLSDILNRSKEYRHAQSFHDVDICYRNLDMGDEIHGIFGATCGEPLHVLGQGLDVYAFDAFLNSLCADSERTLKRAVMNLVPQVTRQSSAKNLLCVNAFRNGLTKLNILTADEKLARLFAIYLALLTSDCCCKLATNPKKGYSKSTMYGLEQVKRWLELLESMLSLTMWFKLTVVPPNDVYNISFLNKWKEEYKSDKNIEDYNLDFDTMSSGSRAQKRIVQFLELYHSLVGDREGNGLSLPKYHLLLHFSRNIIRHGPVENYDTARLEANAKESGKTPALRTQMQHKTISYQTAVRYHEDLTVLDAERLCNGSFAGDSYTRKNSYFNMSNSNGFTKSGVLPTYSNSASSFTTVGSSRFTFSFNRENRVNNPNMRTSKMDWDTPTIPQEGFDGNMLNCLSNWLWVDPRGGKITEDSLVKGFTEIQMNGCTYRAHPCYRDNGSWYDWAMVKWEGSDDPIPAKIYMFFEINRKHVRFVLENSHIETPEDHSSRNPSEADDNILPANIRSPVMADDFIQQHQYWAIIHSGVTSKLAPTASEKTEYHLNSKLAYRVLLESQKYRLIPIDSIVGPVYAFMNYSLTDSVFDETAVVVEPKQFWAEKFINQG